MALSSTKEHTFKNSQSLNPFFKLNFKFFPNQFEILIGQAVCGDVCIKVFSQDS